MATQMVYMSSPIEALDGVGKITLAVFHKAELRTIGDLYSTTCGQVLQDALRQMREESDDVLQGNQAYWKGLGTRVQTVISRVRSEDARPYEPVHLVCPITWQLMTDPVLSK